MRACDVLRTYYIYGLADPTTKELRYVGMSVKPWNRLHEHRSHARKPNSRMAASEWIAGLLEKGLDPELIILEEYETDSRWIAIEVEKQWIAHCLNEGAPLLNRHYAKVIHRFSGILPSQEPVLRLDPVHGWYYVYKQINVANTSFAI